jgi:hypothetical protein
MIRIISLSIVALMTVGVTNVVLSETLKQDGSETVKPDGAETNQQENDGAVPAGQRLATPPTIARSMGGIPNPDAPARSQLDPGLHYVGPKDFPAYLRPAYDRSMGGIPNPDAPSQLDPGLHYVGPKDFPAYLRPAYARSMGGIPNPDAPARSQLDPGLPFVGP